MVDRARRHVVAAGVAALALAACRRRPRRRRRVDAGSTVLALGDSITHGTGADEGSSYPHVLAALSGWQVINAGVPGDTSARALARLPALLAAERPALVLISIGGNDFLQRLPEADTRANVEHIVAEVQAAGAQPVLIGVPRPTLLAAAGGKLADHPLFEQVALAHDVPLVAGAWADVLGDERLKSDSIHANAAGYSAFASALLKRLSEFGIGP